MTANKKYKDTLFRHLFNTEEKLLELFNAIFRTNYQDIRAITINTLGDILFKNMKNDISFIIHDTLVFIEHQSTVNENMPLRMLMFLSRIYEKIATADPKAIFRQRLLELPNPQFIVLYNGKEDFPPEKTLRLSTALKNSDEKKNFIDLEVRVININKGVNPELERKSKTLAGYIALIEKVREYEKKHSLEEAIRLAVKYCIDNDILKEYLKQNSSEVVSMLTTEFDMDIALEVAREEGIEKGIEKGIKEGRKEGMEKGMEKTKNYVLELLAQGLSQEEIKKKIEEI